MFYKPHYPVEAQLKCYTGIYTFSFFRATDTYLLEYKEHGLMEQKEHGLCVKQSYMTSPCLTVLICTVGTVNIHWLMQGFYE